MILSAFCKNSFFNPQDDKIQMLVVEVIRTDKLRQIEKKKWVDVDLVVVLIIIIHPGIPYCILALIVNPSICWFI